MAQRAARAELFTRGSELRALAPVALAAARAGAALVGRRPGIGQLTAVLAAAPVEEPDLLPGLRRRQPADALGVDVVALREVDDQIVDARDRGGVGLLDHLQPAEGDGCADRPHAA